ncbi:photosynthetic complex putative assembly protein PuhB, partial [Nostoc sp. NIES-2111]
MSDDYDVEPIPGLPALPPKGETILWQGKPDWHSFAMSALHVRMVFAWFGLIGAFRLASAWHDGALTSLVWTQIAFLALLSLIAAALLCAFAYAVARTTVYTVTNRRVVMRFGVALPMTVNLPYSQIDGASLRNLGEGFGDIPLVLASNRGLSWMVLWPHA